MSKWANPIIERIMKYANKGICFDMVSHKKQMALLDALLKNDKKGLFTIENAPVYGFSTGNPLVDALNGFLVCVPDGKNFKVVKDTWYNMGIMGGQFLMIIGNAGVGKTAFCVQCATSIVAPYEDGLIIHLDAEHTSNEAHIMNLSGWDFSMMHNHYRMPGLHYLEQTRSLIIDIARAKEENKKQYMIDTGRYDSFGNKIKVYVPTVLIMDSLPQFQTNEVLDADGNVKAETEGQTYDMRLAAAYSKFFRILRPIIHDKNIIVFITNHIKDRPQMGFIKKASKIQGLSPDETLPGGTAPIYLSQSLLRLIYKGKCTYDKHGYNGYVTGVQTLKSKTNRSDLLIELAFEHGKGFNTELSMLRFADSLDLLGGRNPYRFFKAWPDKKFSTKDFMKAIENDPNIKKALWEICDPYIKNICSQNAIFDPTGDVNLNQLENVIDNAFGSQKDVSKNTLARTLDGIEESIVA